MSRTPRPAYDRPCDCTCPIHHGQPRSIYNDPGCHCLTTCASQPMTPARVSMCGPRTCLTARTANHRRPVLDRHNVLWYVPGLQPGHWDWRYASPVPAGHPMYETGDLITDLLREANTGLISLAHLL